MDNPNTIVIQAALVKENGSLEKNRKKKRSHGSGKGIGGRDERASGLRENGGRKSLQCIAYIQECVKELSR